MATIPFPHVRRIVTGHNAKGEATIVQDSSVHDPLPVVHGLFRSDEFPIHNGVESKGGWVDSAAVLGTLAAAGGVVSRVYDMAPGQVIPMHRTISMDVGVILKGTITLEVENGEQTLLKEGDTCIQRGTLHGWKNESTEWCRMLFILVGALPVEILLASALASVAFAQNPVSGVWQQCGGIGWTGATTCDTGATCTKLNDYYSQCIPSAAGPTTSDPGPTDPPTTSAPSGPVATPPPQANYWFSFGDSYTQTGFLPNETAPAVGNPLGNPPYPGYTAVGGTNWIDVDTIVYNKSLILTWNYAYGGATIDAKLVTPYEPTVLSLTDQVNQFLTGAASKPASAPWTSSNSLFSFWIGINDIGNSYYQSGDRDAFSDTLLDAYFALIQKIVSVSHLSMSAVGGRNFLFINVPPVDRSPLMLGQATSAQTLEKSVITGFNTKLASRAAAFKTANAGVQTWVFDSNAAFTTVLNDPQAYGFVDATSYGGTGDFWGNNLHPTSAVHEIIGKQIGQLLGNTVW
ncbi:hypothetical protein EIP91_007733 [Steccherinum ochraceum]|uniref:CBM1 domain-containing protein n=1 Tax=Steccherinum ochraceum TaxID=92696 RepID=A0A4R0RNY3_9APHY|nr:hypothetical protein EIP91_007733 [Steccherinum ochraceum]